MSSRIFSHKEWSGIAMGFSKKCWRPGDIQEMWKCVDVWAIRTWQIRLMVGLSGLGCLFQLR